MFIAFMEIRRVQHEKLLWLQSFNAKKCPKKEFISFLSFYFSDIDFILSIYIRLYKFIKIIYLMKSSWIKTNFLVVEKYPCSMQSHTQSSMELKISFESRKTHKIVKSENA